MTSHSELKVGDKVRYIGKTPELKGLEGVLTHAGKRVATVEVTNANTHYSVGHTAYPDTTNIVKIEPIKEASKEAVEHPAHYGGGDNPYEVIKVAEAWGLDKDAYLFNVLKYIARAGKKDGNTTLQDLKKGLFYLKRRIGTVEAE